jgi:hypothetical protein
MHYFNYNDLEQYVIDYSKSLCEKYTNSYKMASVLANVKQRKDNVNAEMKRLEKELSEMEKQKDILYEDRLGGVISVDDFTRLSSKINDNCQRIRVSLNMLKAKSEEKVTNKDEQEEVIKEFLSLNKPTHTLMAHLIEKIEVHQRQNQVQKFDIHYRFEELQILMEQEKSFILG